MITMNRKTRATHRFRGVVAGIAAALMMFGLADLIARAFTPSAAPLLTLGQAIIPLAPPAAIKPVIALFGDNDKLVLVLSTGLGAIVVAGLIGALAVSRRRLATRLLVVAGLVPVIVIIIRPEAGAFDVIPTFIGIAAGIAVFVMLLRLGTPQTLAEAVDRPDIAPSIARGSQPSDPLSRRRFFGLAGALGAIGAVTIAAGQTVASLAQDAGAAVAKLVLPTPAKKAAAIPAAPSTDLEGTVPFLRIVKSRSLAEEVLQECFTEVWTRCSGFDPARGTGRAWLVTLCRRRAIDCVRSVQSQQDRDFADGLRTSAEAADGVEQTVIDRAESDRTVSALKILPEEQSTPIVMAFYQGLTHAQISEDLKVPLGTIKSRIRDGMKKLRDELEASR